MKNKIIETSEKWESKYHKYDRKTVKKGWFYTKVEVRIEPKYLNK